MHYTLMRIPWQSTAGPDDYITLIFLLEPKQDDSPLA